MKILRIAGFVIVTGLVGSFCYFESNIGLLGDDYLLIMVSTDVLGNPLYGKSCTRSLYIKDVEINAGKSEEESGVFKFYPISGIEKECPPISVITDRRTGEAWLRE